LSENKTIGKKSAKRRDTRGKRKTELVRVFRISERITESTAFGFLAGSFAERVGRMRERLFASESP
jgi:hypothetical protein